MTGRFDEAVAEMKRAAELDPLSPIISTDMGATLFLARRYDAALDELRRTLELYPGYELGEIWLARTYEAKKDCTTAISVTLPVWYLLKLIPFTTRFDQNQGSRR